MIRPLGHLPDPPGLERGQEIGRLLGSTRSNPPAQASLGRHAAPVIDQRGSSCLGAACRGALAIAASIGGWTLDPSYLAIYALARQLHVPGNDILPDLGAYPHRAFEALEDWGVVSRERWPDDSDIERPVAVDVLEAGASAVVTGVYRIREDGARRARIIRESIAAGHPVVFGMAVDDAYMRWSDARTYPGRTGEDRGGHAQVIVGYTRGAFIVQNSWGRDWGASGFAWLDEGWVESPECYDFTALTTAPRSVR